MGIIVKQCKNDKYGLYSTVTDSMIHKGTLSRDQAINILKERIKFYYSREIEEVEKTFPNGYSSIERKRIHDDRYLDCSQFAEYWWKKNWGKNKT